MMPGDGFELVVSGPGDQGADLSTLIDTLDALRQIYLAAAVSQARPGSDRPRLPAKASQAGSLRITSAKSTNSLAVQLAFPDATQLATSEYQNLPARAAKAFVETVRAVDKRDGAKITELYPEKVDRIRVLQKISAFANNAREKPPVIVNLTSPGERQIFHQDIQDWVQQEFPSTDPEVKTYKGMIRAGSLGGEPRFKIFDGIQVTRILPNPQEVETLRDLFGRVAEVTGLTVFKADGSIKHVEQLSSVRPYNYSCRIIESDKNIYKLEKTIQFLTQGSLTSKEFLLSNDEFDIYAYGTSLRDAIDALGQDFECQWNTIVEADVAGIHPSAVDMRHKLQALVSGVESKDA